MVVTAFAMTALALVGALRPPLVVAGLALLTLAPLAARTVRTETRRLAGVPRRPVTWAIAIAGLGLAAVLFVIPSHAKLDEAPLPASTTVWYYARLAQDVGAAMLIIGTELANPVRQRPAFWRALIREVRRVYDGEVTYAANWYEEYEHVTFWEDLDYIGVQAYFPLSEHESPSLDAIKAGWKPHQSALAALHEKTGRPILFTEIGYRSVPYAAIEPWRWLARDEPGQVEPDYELQARLYQAFFERCWHQPWLSGVFVWKWYGSTGRRGRDRHTLDFTPQDKPAEQVIGSWFTQF
jgi:hypothetical protein